MAGIDEILNMIELQQQQTENSIITAANRKATAIAKEGREKADEAYSDSLKSSKEKLAQFYENTISSIDAEMKRRVLACKVECIGAVIEKTLEKLNKLPDKEYFAVMERLLEKKLTSGDGVLSLSKRDLARAGDFGKKAAELAKKAGGTVKLSDKAADIENGFILTYGLISENCSFRAIIEAEREGVRDTAARALFG